MRTSITGVRLASCFAALALSVGLLACGSDDSNSEGDGDLTVFAAASLTEAFTELGKQYETGHEGATVKFNFASSSDLAAQIDQD